MNKVLINIDVNDLVEAEAFYTKSFDLKPARRFGRDTLELLGHGAVFYLLEKREGTKAFPSGQVHRTYARHWTPVHLDFVVNDIEETKAKLGAAGVVFAEDFEIRSAPYGRIFECADPFGNGLCVIEFAGRGYDELLAPQK